MNKRNKTGSAIVVVLGLLAVLTLMAVSFSVIMRIERAGTTNLRHRITAGHFLKTALAHAVQAVDDYDNQYGDKKFRSDYFPLPYGVIVSWNNPMLVDTNDIETASGDKAYATNEWSLALPMSGTDNVNDVPLLGLPSYGGAARPQSRPKDSPMMLTRAAAQMLSPSQAGLVRSANAKWRYISSGMETSHRYNNTEDLERDHIVGRYAFVVLDATGYLDINLTSCKETTTSTNNLRAAGMDPTSLKFDEGLMRFSYTTTTNAAAVTNFLTRREDFGGFSSYADFKANVNEERVVNYCFDQLKKGATYNYDIFYPELFGGVSQSFSLESLTPEKKKKTVLMPNIQTNQNFNTILNNIHTAFTNCFNYDNDVNENEHKPVGNVAYKFYAGGGRVQEISRGHMATLGLLDYLDDDILPNRSEVGSKNYIDTMNTELKPVWNSRDPADFPCFEPVPLINQVMVHIEEAPEEEGGRGGDAPEINYYYWNGNELVKTNGLGILTSDDDPQNFYIERKFTLTAACQAVNWSKTVSGKTFTLEGEFTFSGLGGRDGDDPSPLKALLDGEEDSGGRHVWVWDDAIDKICDTTIEVSGSGGGYNETTEKYDKRAITAESDITFEVKVQSNNGPIKEDETKAVEDLVYTPEFSALGRTPYSEDHDPENYNDICLQAEFTGEITLGGRRAEVIQMVPGPSCPCESLVLNLPFHYFKPRNTETCDDKPENCPENDDVSPFEYGWAMCIDPRFAFDTSFTAGSGDAPWWMSNARCHDLLPSEGEGRGGRTGDEEDKEAIMAEILNAESRSSNDVGLEFTGHGGGNLYSYFTKAALAGGLPDSGLIPAECWQDLAYFEYREGVNCHPCPDCIHVINDNVDYANTVKGKTEGEEPPRGERLPTFEDDYVQTCLCIEDGKVGEINSVADLGNLTIGPLETISLFYTKPFSSIDDLSKGWYDFHPVLDYFTLHDSVYPTINDPPPTYAFDTKGQPSDEHKPARFSGRVNLNAPKLMFSEIRYIDTKAPIEKGRVRPVNYDDIENIRAAPPNFNTTEISGIPTEDYVVDSQGYNPEPIAVVFNGMEINKKSIEWEEALTLAMKTVANTPSGGWTGLSRLGCGFCPTEDDSLAGGYDTTSDIFTWLVEKKELAGDYAREDFLRNSVEHFTTRGQTYIVLLRAETYIPAYGSSKEGGRSLASVNAIAELWRDPEPARDADGKIREPEHHNWWLRSFRVLDD